MYIPASGGPANDPTPSKIKRIPYPTAKLCSPRNSIIIGGSKGPPTADKNPKMTDGQTPLDLARQFNQHQIVEYLSK